MDFDTAPSGKRLRLASGVLAFHNCLAIAGILIAVLPGRPTAAQISSSSLLLGVPVPVIEPLPVVDLPHAMKIGVTCFAVGRLSVELMALDRGIDKGGKR